MDESSHIANSKAYEEFIDKKFSQHNTSTQSLNAQRLLKASGIVAFGLAQTILGWVFQQQVNMKSDDVRILDIAIDFVSKLIFTIGIFLIFYGGQEIIVQILFKKYSHLEFVAIILVKIKFLSSLCLAFLFSALIFRYKNKDTQILNLGDIEGKGESFTEEIIKYLKKILNNKVSGLYLAIATVLSVFIIRKAFMVVLNYNLHKIHYSTRIDQNKRDMKIVKKLNQFVNATFADNVDVIVTRIVNALSPETGLITLTSLQAVFGSAASHAMMDAACKEGANIIDFESLREFYLNAYKEQELLSLSMSQSDTSVESLDILTRIIAIVAALILVLSSAKDANFYVISLRFAGIISSGYFFSDMIKIVFSSIIFVFIIRPFEVNDVVKINNILYTVEEMNIMTTTFLHNKIKVKSPNYKLFEMSISNFRASRHYEMEYKLRFKAKDFKEKRDSLLDMIRTHVKNNPRTFKNLAYYKSVNLVEAKGIEVVVVVMFKIQNVDIQTIRKYKEEFAMKLDELLHACSLKRREGSGNKDS